MRDRDHRRISDSRIPARVPLPLLLWLVWLACAPGRAVASSSGNFPLASAPIPYPSFEVDALDSKLTGSYERVTDGTAVFNGGVFNFKGRYAPTKGLGVGLEMPYSYLTGNLGSDGNDGTESLQTVSPVLNFQWLAIDSSSLSLIVFGGFNYNYGWGSAQETSNGQPGTLSFTGSTMGFLAGAQAGIPIFNGIIFTPSYTFTRNFGGSTSATITTPTSTSSTTDKIPGYYSQGFGLDFIFPEPFFSIGSLLQQVITDLSSGQSTKVLLLEASWHFGVPKFRR